MEQQPERKKPNLLSVFAKNYSGSLTQTALSAMSAWTIVTGLKEFAGFTVTQQTVLADLLGIIIVIGIARWLKVRHDLK